jgi:hypothetical protein
MIEPLGQSLSFGRLSLKAKVLWPMLLAAADDQGRLQADAQALKWGVCPNVDEITRADIPDLLAEMAEQEMILLYEGCIQITKWWQYQHRTSWAAPSKLPAPEGWTDRVRYHGLGNAIQTSNWSHPGGFAVATPPLPSAYVAPTLPLPSNEVECEVEGECEGEGEVEGEGYVAATALQIVYQACESAGMIFSSYVESEHIEAAVTEYPPTPAALTVLVEYLPKFARNLDHGKRLSTDDVVAFLSLLFLWPLDEVKIATDQAVSGKKCSMSYIRATLEGRAGDGKKNGNGTEPHVDEATKARAQALAAQRKEPIHAAATG